MTFRNNIVRMSGGPITYYNDLLATNLYQECNFGGNINSLTVTNDSSTDDIQLSYDGATLEAELKPNESLTLNTSSKTSVRIKGTAGGDYVRIWGW